MTSCSCCAYRQIDRFTRQSISADTEAGAITASRPRDTSWWWRLWWYATKRNIDGQRIRTQSLIAHSSQYPARNTAVAGSRWKLTTNMTHTQFCELTASPTSAIGVNCSGLSKTLSPSVYTDELVFCRCTDYDNIIWHVPITMLLVSRASIYYTILRVWLW